MRSRPAGKPRLVAKDRKRHQSTDDVLARVDDLGDLEVDHEAALAHRLRQIVQWLRHVRTGADDVQLDKSFTDDLDVDSLSMVEIIYAAEEKFGVSIPDEEAKNLKTVGDAVAYIERAAS
jgi:acyl carrier protein